MYKLICGCLCLTLTTLSSLKASHLSSDEDMVDHIVPYSHAHTNTLNTVQEFQNFFKKTIDNYPQNYLLQQCTKSALNNLYKHIEHNQDVLNEMLTTQSYRAIMVTYLSGYAKFIIQSQSYQTFDCDSEVVDDLGHRAFMIVEQMAPLIEYVNLS